MSYYAYTPITDDPVVLDLTGCNDLGDLHQRIRKTFGFPGYYGENWDAMWDCLTDVFLWESDRRAIHIKGYNTMSNELQNHWRLARTYEPKMGNDERSHLLSQWHRAVERTRDWAKEI